MTAPTLEEGAAALGLDLSHDQFELLRRFLQMLQKWNRVYNLTAVRDPAEMLTHHLLDSLAVVPALWRQRTAAAAGQEGAGGPGVPRAQEVPPFSLLDVGSGGGLPGVVIAICCPQAQVRCVDTVAKKAAFQQQVAAELRLDNLRGIHARVENLDTSYDVVCSRAFASLADFTRWSSGSLAADGVWMAMKGRPPTAELAELDSAISVFHVEQVQVPGLDAERCIVWMRRTSPAQPSR